ncbi:MAG: hypothetical protein P9F19_06215 [Candidatus Contendobacter sp.]|nr:hypothetical protein [Candidatus Contendobacter sp.]MDG4556964.1 hypothetical protein [Candidatus Contendobacter sp.]
MIRLDLEVIAHLVERWRVLEQDLALKAHDACADHLIRSVPGIECILTLVILHVILRKRQPFDREHFKASLYEKSPYKSRGRELLASIDFLTPPSNRRYATLPF